MELSTTPHGDGATIMFVRGEFDAAVADELRDAALATLRFSDCTGLHIDMAEVSFMDCSGITALLQLHNHTVTTGQHLTVINPSSQTRRILNLTGSSAVLLAEPDLA
jgi:anti-anti-sigma factor